MNGIQRLNVYRSLIVIFGALALTLSASAQEKEDESVEWMVTRGTGDRFSVEVPRTLTGKDSEDDRGVRKGTIYWAGTGDTYYYIFDDVGSIKDSETVSNISNYFSRRVAGDTADNQVYRLKGADNFFHWIVVREEPENTLVFHAVSHSEDDPNVARFFAKLTIGGELFTGFESIELVDLSSKNGNSPASKTKVSKTVSPRKDLPNRQFRLTKKPKAMYTNMARYYWLSGTVTLRITFLLDGTIGDVSVVRPLPFGLTASAIEAARKMKFLPAIREGKAVSQTRPAEYSFTIY